ncbi:hypothetical protein [Aliirhizobium cellulosilyticum]|uniref:Uncharacterized protein n=1 Tax=Aliirhizobium cellulosilyticum TaxID=393664 RepID=A0A7W6TG77_9HYPH|nr:hypothetical protein [Rhizobium cellulosilyticum]MBB4349661.1 hypothetical protein [Rhizobium cellulosilyticum]MBB4412118.1 hypothetical protein [Rhizobium cellulosilyticum]MBB4446749.1 hypothetical protein [Rhizobium cellulosilyticum]
MEDHYDTLLFHHSVNALSLTVEDEQVIPVAYKVIGAIEVMGEKISPEHIAAAGGLRSAYLRRFAFR